MAKVASASLDANLILSQATSPEQLRSELTQHDIKAVIFEPTLPLGAGLTIDGLYQLMPELRDLEQGSAIRPQQFGSLRLLLQTNFYSYPGVFKFRVSPALRRASSTTPATSTLPSAPARATSPSRCPSPTGRW